MCTIDFKGFFIGTLRACIKGMAKQITFNEVDKEYRHNHPALKALEKHITHNVGVSAINYSVIKTVNGYELVNVGIVLIDKSIMDKVI